MTKEELLKPRYKVIARYPNMIMNDGIAADEIIYPIEKHNILFHHGIDIANYPHLFKRLEWWEHRTIQELPKFIRWSPTPDQESFFEVENWWSNPNTGNVAGIYVGGNNRLFIKDCTPATEEEFKSQLIQGDTI